MSWAGNFIYEACLPVHIEVERDSFTADTSWIVGAFFLGLFLGGGITVCCVPPLLRSWEKKKRQDEEELLKEEAGFGGVSKHTTRSGHITLALAGTESYTISENRQDTSPPELNPVLTRGMADVLVKPTMGSSEAEMTDQDLQCVIEMEKDFDKDKDFMYQKILKMKLKKLKDKGRITNPYMDSIMQKVVSDMRDGRRVLEDDKKEAEDELRNKHSKDTGTLETELENLESKNRIKLHNLRKEEQENMRQDLLKSSGLTEAEVDALMEKLMQELSEAERIAAIDQARQARNLEERLAKRRHIVELRNLQQQKQEEEIGVQSDGFQKPVNRLIENGQYSENQKKELLDTYDNDLQKIHNQHKKDFNRHQAELAQKLRTRRLKHMQELAEKQAKEKAQFMYTAEKGTDTADFIQGYHQLVQQQTLESEELQTDLDNAEVQDLDKLKMQYDAERARKIEERKNTLVETLESSAHLNVNEAQNILKLHKQEMAAFQMRRKEDQQRIEAKLREKWEQKSKQLKKDEENVMIEQMTLTEQQQTTVKKVLASNMDLTEEAKDKILKEHERNMNALNNQLQQSRLRQQKSLEHKLSQRRARIEELKQKHELLNRSKSDAKQKDTAKLQQQLAVQIEEEEKRLQKEKQTALNQLHQRLSAETEEALKQQEKELGILIGRLQVGHAHRQAVLEKQDLMLQQLQSQLEKKLETGDGMSQTWADQIIQQHYNQVEHLNAQIQYNRERQENVLQEKIQIKKYTKEKEVENQLKQEAQADFASQRRRGAGIASAVLNDMLLEQRHQNAMSEMEHEMKIELDRSKNELYTQLQHDLEQELQEQKKNFLEQLAAASNISKNELNEVVTAAVSGTGGNDKTAKKLAKELQAGIERAKTSLGMEDSDEEVTAQGHQRPRSAYTHGNEMGDMQTPQDFSQHTGTAKKKRSLRSKKAFVAPAEMMGGNAYGSDDDF
ncbi:hypothetical protein ScPMuIL_001534 [Solemya velum]